ncbi:rhomboid-related protein 4 [Syngnathoides biaculeatus]|uniref:rhomboid-related protein 4 n=1 Tax=Syngnathoides biaculeatus TaxID=300417 RepID=UPI002ADDCA6B|nr:rhomboid-related protein 4 [Syngnathoides biaculeatus]XP_061683067.1 rhomboid-related protein 4 [Syngnathoides biaculeatus]XP_061683069.1 rhomboid-related protein 4 [Syngnathoides biaculeatus]
MRGRQRSSHLGLLLLLSQLYQVGLDNVPPVTLAVLGLNAYLFLFPAAPLMKACVSVRQAWGSGEWSRLILSPFHHADDMHLYFNMVSLLMKGLRLERRLGAAWFAYTLAVFSLLTGVLYLAMEAGLTQLTGDGSHSAACAVGFSGVLFALKVLNNHYHPGGVTYVMGFPVANRYASWVELVLIHITAPGTSLIGHLAGILAGLLYTTGPLKKMMKTCAGLMSNSIFKPRTSYSSSGYSGSHRRSEQYPTDAGTSSSYTGGMTEEEQLAAAIRNSFRDTGRHQHGDGPAPPPYGFRLTEEELRARRLARLDAFM